MSALERFGLESFLRRNNLLFEEIAMNIGIMTFHWAANHGALLQTYALQETLSQLIPDCTVSVVDYKPAQYDMSLKRAIRSRSFKVIRNNLKDIKKERILAPFRERFHKTYRYYSVNQLLKRPPHCDVFIAGSDQIWNEFYTLNGEGQKTSAYYLPFHAGAKHISYAASFGTTQLKPEMRAYILPYLRRLDAVSVREKTGKQLLDEMGVPCQIVCDPSALLPTEAYRDIAEAPFSGSYTAKYFLRGESAAARQAIRTTAGPIQDCSLLPMEQWLGAIGNAEFLLTNSFHGMMVALKMHTPFAVFLTEGALSGMNDRFATILELLHLTDRIVTSDNPVQVVQTRTIDWTRVDQQMEAYISDSVAFLKTHCTPLKKSGPITHYRNAECCGCTACEQICPKKCIQMVSDSEGFLYPQVDTEACIHCGKCIDVCPIRNTPITQQGTPVTQAFVARATDQALVRGSSSGGVFTILAQYVLQQQGVVFSVAMSDDCRQAVYKKVENVSQLAEIRGSKYVQSNKNDVFLQVKQSLDAQRQVLFCGTPCDVNGIYNYLQQTNTPMDHLLLVDFICHGVPSPLVWERYVEFRQNAAKATAQTAEFRNKAFGWSQFSMSITFSNGKTYLADKDRDPFLRGFLADLYLRPSCHECAAKGERRVSDLTVGDAWGLSHMLDNDDRGASVIMIHSSKMRSVISQLNHKLQSVLLENTQPIVQKNSALMRSSALTHRRHRFMSQLYSGKRIDRLIISNCRDPFILALKKAVKRLLK